MRRSTDAGLEAALARVIPDRRSRSWGVWVGALTAVAAGGLWIAYGILFIASATDHGTISVYGQQGMSTATYEWSLRGFGIALVIVGLSLVGLAAAAWTGRPGPANVLLAGAVMTAATGLLWSLFGLVWGPILLGAYAVVSAVLLGGLPASRAWLDQCETIRRSRAAYAARC